MMAAFAKVELPNFYKLDKTSYSRADISDIGHKIAKKIDDLEAIADYERRKNNVTTREKLELQQRVNELLEQVR